MRRRSSSKTLICPFPPFPDEAAQSHKPEVSSVSQVLADRSCCLAKDDVILTPVNAKPVYGVGVQGYSRNCGDVAVQDFHLPWAAEENSLTSAALSNKQSLDCPQGMMSIPDIVR